MTSWHTIFELVDSVMGSYYFLFVVFSVFLILKGWIVTALIRKTAHISSTHFTLMPLIIAILASMVDNMSWVLRSIRSLWFPGIDFRIYLFLIRVAWGCSVIYYQALTIFISNLVTKERRLPVYQRILIPISSVLFFAMFGLAIINYNCPNAESRPAFEWTILSAISFYTSLVLPIISFYLTTRKEQLSKLPIILRQQLELLFKLALLPYWLSDFLQVFPLNFGPSYVTNSYTFVSVSNILFILGTFICARKIMGLRFLNLEDHVQSPINNMFMEGLKHTLEQLSYVTNSHELKHITQNFFKESFNITIGKATLYIRKSTPTIESHNSSITYDSGHLMVETFIATADTQLLDHIKEARILIYDEIAFTNFYEEAPTRSAVLTFLETIGADIFLPMYEENEMIGYIVIDRRARSNQLYSNLDRDEMLIFSNYLGNIINLLQNKNLDNLLRQNKNIQEELYRKHQEIHQYKESIRSFLRTTKKEHIGIIFYKNRRFTFGNQAAQELISININTLEGHPLSKALRQLAHHVEAYKNTHSVLSKDTSGNQLILSAVPHLEHNQVIIMIYYPEISDLLKRQIDLLHDPSEWDYLLYLETTQSGKLINQLIPGSGPTLLKFKIELLKLALSKKALLLNLPHEDLLPTVELLHHINLREKLQVVELHQPSTSYDIAIKLFGINQIFGVRTSERPLLSSLDTIGTLFIKNVHFLDRETQEYLAEFINYGFYRTFKGTQKIPANVRIICSSDQDLHTLVQENKFSLALFNELKQAAVSMPSLSTLTEKEFNNLAEAFSEQSIQEQPLKHLFALTEVDKHKIGIARPTSLHDLKYKIQQLLAQKSKRATPSEEITGHINPIFPLSDPDLIQAARLGKQALKDEKIMVMLWEKLKSQNKIAHFLGVNRSSVNRRCKEYNLN